MRAARDSGPGRSLRRDETRRSSDAGVVAYSDRVAARLGIVLGLVTLLYAYLQIVHYELVAAGVVLVVASLMLFASPLANRTRLGALHYGSAVLYLALSLVAYARGGLVIAVLPFGLAAPIGAIALSRSRAAAFWIAMMVPQAAVLGTLEAAGLTPPKIEASVKPALISAWSLVVVLVALVLIQERERAKDVVAREEIQRQLERADRLEGLARLAGGVAHDFNNLLSVVVSHARAQRLREPDRDTSDLEAIENAAEAGARLTRRLLAIGREDQGRAIEPVELHDLVSDVLDLLRKALPETVAVERERGESPAVVMAEPRQLEQIVMNLALNARDAMPEGGRLVIRTRVEALEEPRVTSFVHVPSGDYALLEVEDAGNGISPELLDRILEPFFTTKPRDRGTGLGLAVVDGVVESLQGHLDIESEVGVGTTFRIYIPRVEREVPAPDIRHSTPDTPPALILLVEDDPAVRRATRRVLRMEGHAVLEASDVHEALAISDEHEGIIDVLITDVVMPGPSGAMLARQIRQRRPEIGVIFFSGYAGDGLDAADLAADRTLFLRKPPARDDLTRAIRAVLDDTWVDAPRSSA